ncbi:Pentatricopeptide repeat-containing protein [Platanthera zijinensis]|uniref:Pentatricopeptide repeat-containing protein n=1 Tax=Platanthera zijinensis TaxID=2320716 RepID=A0AAP0FVI5_9ASPA
MGRRYPPKDSDDQLLLSQRFQPRSPPPLPPNAIRRPTAKPFHPSGLLRSASNLSDTSTGRFLHSFAIRSLLTPDAFISSALIELYSKHGRIKDARHVFDETPEKDLVVWNSMVSGFSQSGYEQKALKLLDSMRAAGIEADVFSWTSLISGSVRNFNYGRAFLFFRQMVGVAGISPNAATISSLLPASANVMNLRRGREIHGFSVVAGVESDLFVSTRLWTCMGSAGLYPTQRRYLIICLEGTLFHGMPWFLLTRIMDAAKKLYNSSIRWKSVEQLQII